MLFWLAWGIALVLIGCVLLAPWLTWHATNSPIDRFGSLFANDALVRRTSVACALGLVVTAHIFFQTERTNPSPNSDVEEDNAKVETDETT